jgi:uncharacterized protein
MDMDTEGSSDDRPIGTEGGEATPDHRPIETKGGEAAGEAERPRRALSAPVAPLQRVGSVDVLRGFALLGILVMNIYAFAMPWSAYWNPFAGGGQGSLDRGTWWFTHLVFEMKFMTLFSMLFGAGLALMAQRAEAKGGRFGGIYYRRLLWLLLIGMVHAYLMWFGDILVWYALCGLILYPLRRVRPRFLIPIGAVLICVVVPSGLFFGYTILPEWKRSALEAEAARDAGEELTEEQETAIELWAQQSAGAHPDPEDLEEEVAVYKEGSWGDQVVFRAPLVLQMQIGALIFFGFWRIAGLMLIGMGLLKLGVFSAARSLAFYAWCCVIGYGVGLPVVYWGAVKMVDSRWDVFYMNQGGMFPNYFASIAVAFGHLGLVMLVCRSGVLSALTSRLAAVGRMALTNYLSHTIIATTIFYSWGFGLFDDFGRFALMGFVLAIWIFQLVVSPIWLRHFRFGPAEWLWRSLTYWRRQPMALASGDPVTPTGASS